MTDKQYIARVRRMSMPRLLEEILANSVYLTDYYYRDLGKALEERAEQLLAEHRSVRRRKRISMISETPR